SETGVRGPLAGIVNLFEGEWEAARTDLAEGVRSAALVGNRDRQFIVGGWLALVDCVSGEHHQAARLWEELLGLASRRAHLPYELRARCELALFCTHIGQTDKAAAYLERCR